MSAPILLNLLNMLRKRDKMRGMPMSLINLNKTGAQMLDFIYHMTIKLLKIILLVRKNLDFATFTQN